MTITQHEKHAKRYSHEDTAVALRSCLQKKHPDVLFVEDYGFEVKGWVIGVHTMDLQIFRGYVKG